MALGDYKIEDLEPGMHVKIPHRKFFSSWADHLKTDRWWTISSVNKGDFYIKEDICHYGYLAQWVSDVLEYQSADFKPVDEDAFNDLFCTLLSN